MTTTPTNPELAETKFVACLKRTGVRDKANYRLGEVESITGFDKAALLKMRDAGSLTPWRPAGYGWDCYPRDQVKMLVCGKC